MLLGDGIKKFQSDVMPKHTGLFDTLKKGQSPEVLFITCSDSRIDPSMITQTLPGDLFIQRNAGNLVPVYGEDYGTSSAVEYAVSALKVKHIVVCGHSSCGAVTGLMNPESLNPLPAVKQWVSHSAAVAEKVKDLPKAEQVPAAINHNALAQLDNLKTHPSVQKALEAGTLQLHAWVYNIGTGEVTDLQG